LKPISIANPLETLRRNFIHSTTSEQLIFITISSITTSSPFQVSLRRKSYVLKSFPAVRVDHSDSPTPPSARPVAPFTCDGSAQFYRRYTHDEIELYWLWFGRRIPTSTAAAPSLTDVRESPDNRIPSG
jgi:hypothetical protein